MKIANALKGSRWDVGVEDFPSGMQLSRWRERARVGRDGEKEMKGGKVNGNPSLKVKVDDW